MRRLNFRKRPAVRAVFQHYNYVGLVGAVVGFCISFLPSLLPRPWLFQGIVTGCSALIGYGVGTVSSLVIRWLIEWEPPKRVKHGAWRLLAVLGPVAALIYLYLSTGWQNEVRALIGEQPQSERYIFRILFAALVTGGLLLAVARLVHFGARKLIDLIDKLLPRKVSIIAGVGITVYICITLLNGVFFASFVRFANRTYSNQNNGTPAAAAQPSQPERSGSLNSLVSWESLGYQGRGFVGRGPTVEQIEKFNNKAAKQPIRVYAGLHSAPTIRERAELAVKELERTKAFDRSVLVIANATGTGWLEPQAVDSLEYMHSGDTAIASIQYSYLPSWLSFLVDKQNAKTAGQELFDAVYGKWATLPEGQRPKLITYGLSLGSYGGQAAFSGANDLKYAVDGALFVGTPSDTELWNTITKNRDPHSTQIEPVYRSGESVRFESNGKHLDATRSQWDGPRALYLQHASDPVVWFDFDLLLNEPDWLQEPPGRDVSPSMQWYPFITFTQVALDQFLGNTTKPGYGHIYGNQMVAAWAAVTRPLSWTNDDSRRLQSVIDTYSQE